MTAGPPAGAARAARPAENHSTAPRRSGILRDMFRYTFLTAQSAVADAPKAAVNLANAGTAAAFAAAAAPFGGARS